MRAHPRGRADQAAARYEKVVRIAASGVRVTWDRHELTAPNPSSIPLSFHRSTPSEYMYDPSFIPGPPTPTFSIRLPSLSRAPPRPRLKSTSSTSSMTSDTSIPPSPGAGPSSGVPGSTSRPSHTSPFAGRGLERRRSTGQGFLSTGGQVKLTKAAGLGRDGEDAAAQAYMRQYGLKSCLVHEARVEVPGRERERERGRRRRGSLEAEGQHGMGGTNGFGHSHAAGLSSPISFVHPGRITEEPESEEPTPRAQSPASPAPISSSLPSSTRSPFRRGTSALRSRSRSSAGSGVDPSSPRDPALPRIPLRACCAECRLAADLGSRDDAEWAIGFDRKAQEKRARDDAEAARNEGIASMLAAGLRNGGSKREEADDDSGEDVAVAPMKGVVVDEADGVRRRGSDPAVLNGHALPPLLPMDGASDGSASPSRADLVWWVLYWARSGRHQADTPSSQDHDPAPPFADRLAPRARHLSPKPRLATRHRARLSCRWLL